MTLIRWQPVRELNTIQTEVNRLFSSYFDSPTPGNGPGTTLRRWIPAMDLVETDAEFVLRADLPGMAENDVKIELEDRVLTISGERTAEQEGRTEGYHRIERSSGAFIRTLTLPEGVDPAAIKATFDKGVLDVRIPKPEAKKPHRVAIAGGGTPAPEAIEGTEQAA